MVNSTLGSKQNSLTQKEQLEERQGRRDPFVILVSFMAFVFLALLLWLFTTNPNERGQATLTEPRQINSPMPTRTAPLGR